MRQSVTEEGVTHGERSFLPGQRAEGPHHRPALFRREKALQRAPFGGAVSYEVMGTVIALRSADARRIGIEIIQ